MKTIMKLSLMQCLVSTILLQGAGEDPCQKYRKLLDSIFRTAIDLTQPHTLRLLLHNKQHIPFDVNKRNSQTTLTPLADNCSELNITLTHLTDNPNVLKIAEQERLLADYFDIWKLLKDAGADLTRQSFLKSKANIIKNLKKLMEYPSIKDLYNTYKKDLVLEEEAEEAPLPSAPGGPQVKNEEEEEEDKKQNAAKK